MRAFVPSPVPLALSVGMLIVTAAAGQQLRPDKGTALPVTPCCNVTAVDGPAKTITGKVTASGRTFNLKVSDGRALDGVKVGETLDFTVDPAEPSAASSSAGGTTTQGNNAPRNSDTRPKDCIATTSSGQEIKVACPSGVTVKPKK
jgi:hypothetical protein